LTARKIVALSSPSTTSKAAAASNPTQTNKRASSTTGKMGKTVAKAAGTTANDTGNSSLPTVSATLLVRRQSWGLPDHPSTEKDVLEGVCTPSGQAAVLAEEVEDVFF